MAHIILALQAKSDIKLKSTVTVIVFAKTIFLQVGLLRKFYMLNVMIVMQK